MQPGQGGRGHSLEGVSRLRIGAALNSHRFLGSRLTFKVGVARQRLASVGGDVEVCDHCKSNARGGGAGWPKPQAESCGGSAFGPGQ